MSGDQGMKRVLSRQRDGSFLLLLWRDPASSVALPGLVTVDVGMPATVRRLDARPDRIALRITPTEEDAP